MFCRAAEGRGRGIGVNPMPLLGVQTDSRGPSTSVHRVVPGGGLVQEGSQRLYPSRPKMSTGEGLTTGSHRHTVECYLAMKTESVHTIRQLISQARDARDAGHKRHKLDYSMYMEFKNSERSPMVAEVRTHWSLWGPGGDLRGTRQPAGVTDMSCVSGWEVVNGEFTHMKSH